MKKIILLFLSLPLYSTACINAYAVDVFGNYPERSLSDMLDMKLHDYEGKVTEWRKYVETNFHKGPADWEYLNELAVCDIFTGKYANAKEKLAGALAIHGLNYRICANIGVLYELTGNLDSAYYYTKRSLEMEPWSHNGSEWIHLKILEAEKNELKFPGWIKTHTILSIGPDNSREKINSLIYQLNFQLHERMLLVKPANMYVADLLITLGRLNEEVFAFSAAVEPFQLAKRYDSSREKECDSLISAALTWSKGDFEKAVQGKILTDELTRKAVEKTARANTAAVVAARSKLSTAEARLISLRKKHFPVLYILIPPLILIFVVSRLRKRLLRNS